MQNVRLVAFFEGFRVAKLQALGLKSWLLRYPHVQQLGGVDRFRVLVFGFPAEGRKTRPQTRTLNPKPTNIPLQTRKPFRPFYKPLRNQPCRRRPRASTALCPAKPVPGGGLALALWV